MTKTPDNTSSDHVNPILDQDDTRVSDTEYLVEFSAIPWETPAAGVRFKQTRRADQCIRLIEFDESFVESDWCKKGHVGFVIEGTLEIDFGSRVIVLRAGDGLFIPPGESSKHKARVPSGSATLFVVEQAS